MITGDVVLQVLNHYTFRSVENPLQYKCEGFLSHYNGKKRIEEG